MIFMKTVNEMLKAIVLAGRDEDNMEPGENASATNEVMVIFSGYDTAYDEDSGDEIEDSSSEIYEIYINAKALEKNFLYKEPSELLGMEIVEKNQIHIRAVLDTKSNVLHMNQFEEYVRGVGGVSVDSIHKVILAAYKQISD